MVAAFKTDEKAGLYFDNAAGTRIEDAVVDKMLPWLQEHMGNPSSIHSLGRQAAEAVEKARESVADVLGCAPGELYFTSGGTESNNWAVKAQKFETYVCSAVEHPSVSEAMSATGKQVIEIPVDERGMLSLEVLEAELSARDCSDMLVSVQHVNSETGTMQNVAAIGEIVHAHGAVFHVDAVQGFCKADWKVVDFGADMVSVSARKIGGPCIGALYISSNLITSPLMYGGGQQDGMRSGTVDVAYAVGFGKAVELAYGYMKTGSDYIRQCADHIEERLVGYYEGAVRNGNPKSRIPHIVSISVPTIDAALVCGILDSEYNVICSTGSACAAHGGPSRVITAMGGMAASTLRFSLSRKTRMSDVSLLCCQVQQAIRAADAKLEL